MGAQYEARSHSVCIFYSNVVKHSYFKGSPAHHVLPRYQLVLACVFFGGILELAYRSVGGCPYMTYGLALTFIPPLSSNVIRSLPL